MISRLFIMAEKWSGLMADRQQQEMLVKQGALHYNGYIRKSGPKLRLQRKDRILQEEDVEE